MSGKEKKVRETTEGKHCKNGQNKQNLINCKF